MFLEVRLELVDSIFEYRQILVKNFNYRLKLYFLN